MYELIEQSFIANGYSFPFNFKVDGKIHRFKRHLNDKNENGWYVCFVNSLSSNHQYYAGAYGDWSEPGSKNSFCTLIDLDRKKSDQIFKKIDHQIEVEQALRQEECAKSSQEFIKNFCSQLGTSLNEYLTNKKVIGLHGAYTAHEDLIIPIQDIDGKVWSYQRISPDGKKMFQSGTKKKGNFFPIGKIAPKENIYLCEGFATGCTISMAIDKPVLVCFDAGNLVEVAKVIREKYPEILLVICGDSDAFTEGNPGEIKGKEAAAVGLGTYIFPKFKSLVTQPTDFQDLYVLEGLEVVRAQILGVEATLSYVKCLGFQDGAYFYTTSDNMQVTALMTHSESDLARLMPLSYWEAKFPKKNGGVNWTLARFELMDQCRRRGIFTKSHIRGNGVWLDQGKIILHLGDRLFYDGKIHSLHSIDSKYIYELDQALPDIEKELLSKKELIQLTKLLTSFSYSNSTQFMFLGGWMVIAPFCGVLKWRPHLWLTGESGSGKTTLKSCIEDYLKNSFRGLFVTGATTEAGIRQSVRASAFPLVFDEIEPERRKDRDRIDGIMELIRQASSEQDGGILKGSSAGNASSYSSRFCSLLSSVKPRLIAEADKSRFTYISLIRKQGGLDAWPEIERQMGLITPEFSRKLFAYSLHNIENILENIKTFHKAIVSLGHTQRMGQQYGSLLGGFYSLVSDSRISMEEATFRAGQISFESEESVSEMRDQEGCFDFLLGSHFFLDNMRLPLSAFLKELSRHNYLENYRMKVIDDDLWIAANNPQIDKTFENSKWDKSWIHVLKRLDGVNPRKVVNLMGKSTMGILIPRSYFEDEEEVINDFDNLALIRKAEKALSSHLKG